MFKALEQLIYYIELVHQVPELSNSAPVQPNQTYYAEYKIIALCRKHVAHRFPRHFLYLPVNVRFSKAFSLILSRAPKTASRDESLSTLISRLIPSS